MTVGGEPRHVVSAEFVERGSTAVVAAPPRRRRTVSTNEGGGVGRLFAFIVDQNTLDLGNARRVGAGAAPFFSRLTFCGSVGAAHPAARTERGVHLRRTRR